ncbi:DNA topoisomerase 3-alpha [Nymphaea thermarum]|nr:DNA topoisomerase 3-alpha [Nymphaea thermarum]
MESMLIAHKFFPIGGRQLCRNSKVILLGVYMRNVFWIQSLVFGETLVMAVMMTRHTHPFIQQNFQLERPRLYELVVRHFLACVSQPAVGAGTTVEIDIAGESFTASGLMILMKNYLDVYRFESWGGSTIPVYQFGQQFLPTTLTLDSSVTRPPPLLSESDLLGCMDKAGIGTDATMHDHIKKLLDRFYAVKDSNTRFSPTNLVICKLYCSTRSMHI